MVDQQPEFTGWHDKSAEAVLSDLKSARAGLSQDDALTRLEKYGLNRLPEPRRRSALMRFVLQFHNILIYVLIGAAAIKLALDHVIDTLVIMAVVIANAVIGFMQEGRAEKAMDAIRKMLAPHASVLRNGERRTVEGETLVPGGVVLIEAGDKVPADLRLLRAPTTAAEERAAADGRTGLAHCIGVRPVSERRLRHLHLCNRQRIFRRSGPHPYPEHPCGNGDFPSVLHTQHSRHVADVESRKGNKGGLADHHYDNGRAIRHPLPAAASKRYSQPSPSRS